jgi:cystathionine beta-lyase family protein involved in aluminum resistance
VQAAFKRNRIGPHHFQGSTGYGHGDLGREALDNVSMQQLLGCVSLILALKHDVTGVAVGLPCGVFEAVVPVSSALVLATAVHCCMIHYTLHMISSADAPRSLVNPC